MESKTERAAAESATKAPGMRNSGVQRAETSRVSDSDECYPPDTPAGTLLPRADTAALVALLDSQQRRRKREERLLIKIGFRPQLLSNAADLLALLFIAPPDVVLINTGIVDMHVAELCRTLRTRRFFGPIIALSAKPDDRLEVAVLKAGANDFLIYDRHESVLEARLSAHLNAIRGYTLPVKGLLDARELRAIERFLTEREQPLLAVLSARAPEPVSHEDLYGSGAFRRPSLAALTKRMSRLRKKILYFDLDLIGTPGAYRLVRLDPKPREDGG